MPRIIISFLVVLLSVGQIKAQSPACNITLSGRVLDLGTKIPLGFSTVYLPEAEVGVVTDSMGYFLIQDLCPGEYHLEVEHIGCDPYSKYLLLEQNLEIELTLMHHAELLDEVLVHGERGEVTTQNSRSIDAASIQQSSDKNLSDLLEGIAGVTVLRSGSGISKPVIHGLFGNRVAMINNGVVQSGQQWGNDHAPEIDPFVADHISVVKGAGALAYASSSLGGVVLVEVDDIDPDPHLQGIANYIFESNGFGHTVNAQVQQNQSWAAWRLSGTFKRRGDNRSPDYWLRNTGREELNGSIQLEKEWSDQWNSSVYFSLFTTEIGVLRSSHIGNLTDLQAAIGGDVPFFTEPDFSYEIEAPRQEVKHGLLKIETEYAPNDESLWRLKYAGQLNNRKEFDVRRGGRTSTPSLHLNQYTHFGEVQYQRQISSEWFLKSAIQFNSVDNANLPTGVFPLIPRYWSYNPAAFLLVRRESGPWLHELSGRYDFKYFDVFNRLRTVPRSSEEVQHAFHNYGFVGGSQFKGDNNWRFALNLGHLLRSPEVNEMYSNGLHQGVSGIEEGDKNLKAERSTKATLTIDGQIKEKLFFQVLGYYQWIDGFIYLDPQDEFRLTIRGAFPVFKYAQTDAQLSGVDAFLTFVPNEHLKFISQYAIVRGRDMINNEGLVFMPADNISQRIQYDFDQNNAFISLEGKYVWQQTRVDETQDFLATPEAYFLLNARCGIGLDLAHGRLDFNLRVDNMLNQVYRDYLNRLRYFADEPGINVVFGVKYSFE